MYYKEKIINGCLCFRTSPNWGWTQIPTDELSRRLVEAETTIKFYKEKEKYEPERY